MQVDDLTPVKQSNSRSSSVVMCKHQEIIKVLRMIQTLLQSLGQPPVMFGVSRSNSSTEIEQPSDIYGIWHILELVLT